MAIDERKRYQLHSRLEEVLGADEAATLMELLPRVPWRDALRASELPTIRHDTSPRATVADSAIRPPGTLREAWRPDQRITPDRGVMTGVAIAEPPTNRLAPRIEEASPVEWKPGDRLVAHMDRAFNDFRAEIQRELRIQSYLLIGGVALIYAMVTVIMHAAR